MHQLPQYTCTCKLQLDQTFLPALNLDLLHHMGLKGREFYSFCFYDDFSIDLKDWMDWLYKSLLFKNITSHVYDKGKGKIRWKGDQRCMKGGEGWPKAIYSTDEANN